MTSTDIIVLVLLFILAVLAWMYIPNVMTRRAMEKVIAIFREKNAIGSENAKSAIELGLVQKPYLQRMGRVRDYKPRALQYLIQLNVVLMTDEGLLYITEQSLANAPWLKMQP